MQTFDDFLMLILDGYTAGTINQAITQVLNPRRIHHLSNKPLRAVEMVAPLAELDPVSIEEEAEFAKWYDETQIFSFRCS